MTRRSFSRRLGREWGRLAYRARYAPGGERIKAARALREHVHGLLRKEVGR